MELLVIRFVIAFIIAFVITYRLVPLFCAIAFKYNIIDIPDGQVKTHKSPTPYLGGLAVYIGFLTTLALLFSFEDHYFLLLVGSTLLLFIGLIDDLMVLKPYQKFAAQAVAVFCCLKSGLYLKTHFFNNIWSIGISALWCLTIINAFNLVDVMDGLATTLAALITSSLALIALYYGQYSLALLLLVFLGAISAFLCFNLPSASVYLGDAGSLFLGGFLAPIPFLFNWGTYNWNGYFSPIVIFAVPLLEVTSLVIIRLSKGIPFYKPSPDHFCIYLRRRGWSARHILIYMAVLAAGQLCATFLFLNNVIGLVGLCIAAGVFLAIWSSTLSFGGKNHWFLSRSSL